MSRLKKYAHALLSGYVLLGANVVFTLASVPLALHYLSQAEFGLGVLTTQVAGYIALVDLGMAGSISRILIDHKDDRNGGTYGSVIQTGLLVSAIQGGIILAVGLGARWFLGPALKVPPELARVFHLLVLSQCGLVAFSFAMRIFGQMLMAHQRYELTNYPQSAAYLANFAVLWLALQAGAGVFGFIWGGLAGLLVATVPPVWWCRRLGLFPDRGHWGRVSWARFSEVFTFGRDVFLFSLGSLLINASQIILVTRSLGLNAAAVWSVCTRSFQVASQLVWRILDMAGPTLSEMIVRGEEARLLYRFRHVTTLTASLAVTGAVLFAVCNDPFVAVWTNDRFGARSPVFSGGGIKNLPALVETLTARRDALADHLWRSLAESNRQALTAYGDTPVPGTDMQRALGEDLNRVLHAGPLYDERRFAGVALSPSTRRALVQEAPGAARVRLNRRLLEEAYPDLIWPKHEWTLWTNSLLGLWLVLVAVQRCHVGLLGVRKQMQLSKWVYFVEGAVFVGVALSVARWGGFTAIAASSLVCTALCSYSFGLWQTRKSFSLTWREVGLRWLARAAQLGAVLVVAAAGVWLATAHLQPLWALGVRLGVLGPLSVWALWRWGVEAGLRRELLQRLPPAWQRRLHNDTSTTSG